MRDRTSPSQPLTGQSHTAIVATLFVTKSLVTRSMFFKLSLGLITALTVTASLSTQDALAQVRIPVAAIEDTAAIDSLLEEGRQLELDRKWGAALTHYEDASRTHPSRTEFKRRLTVSRIHFDLARRYADSSYIRLLTGLSEQSAIDLYVEVLLKVYSHYVSTPNWQQLVRQGTNHLDIAMAEPSFLQAHLPNATTEQLTEFRREIHRYMDWREIRSRQDARDAVALAGRLAAQRLQLAPTIVIIEYACGAAAALDDYSTYLTPTQLDDVYSQIEGNFVGLGIELKADDDGLLIVNVLSNSPAEQGGIRAGDRIVEVDGQPTDKVSTDRAADMLKGDGGSMVELVVRSADEALRRLQLRRQRVDVPSVEDIQMIDEANGIGYFQLSSFQKTTSQDVDGALWKLHRAGMRSLVVDVRGNPGGLLTAAVEVSDKFVMDGTLVSTRGRSPREDFDYKAHRVGTWRVPLVVLVDKDSASASEIFAGAIRDHNRGKVVGTRSYGKGSVQGIFPLNVANVGVRLTTAKFYTPNGQPISKQGVTPDVVVQIVAKPLDGSIPTAADLREDPVVKAALQVARQQVAQRPGS